MTAASALLFVATGVATITPVATAHAQHSARPRQVSARRADKRRYTFYPYLRSKPPLREAAPVVPSGPQPPPTSSTGPPAKEIAPRPAHPDEAACNGYARLPRGTILLGLVEWTVTPRLQSLYSSGHLSASCRAGVRLAEELRELRLHVGEHFSAGAWMCGVRQLVTVDHGYVPELRVVCSSPAYSFTSGQVNIIVLEAEETGSNYPLGSIYLAGDAVPIGPQSGRGWGAQPGLDAFYSGLHGYYVVGAHACGEAAAPTEAAMARGGGLVAAGVGSEPPGLDFPIEDLTHGTYWACFYLQAEPDEERAAVLMESYVVIAAPRAR